MRARAPVHGRRFRDCGTCRLLFVAPEHHVAPEAEREHYATHHNDPADPGYRAFLDRLARPLVERLPPGAEGLDYGSGPGPTLSRILRERGFPTDIYDPLFAPNPAPLRRRYDFVTCTEAAEHFHHPAHEFARLNGLLRPGGWLGLMTQLVPDDRPLEQWRYVRDPTHVCFYRPATLRWIAERHGWTVELRERGVALFRKGEGEG